MSKSSYIFPFDFSIDKVGMKMMASSPRNSVRHAEPKLFRGLDLRGLPGYHVSPLPQLHKAFLADAKPATLKIQRNPSLLYKFGEFAPARSGRTPPPYRA
jgi:hypothetical protein